MRQHAWGYLAVALLLFDAAVARTAPPSSPAALAPSPGDKCPVCGMFVAKYPDWVAQIRFDDGTTVFFDGAKDLFKYYFSIGTYRPGGSIADISSIYVTDYYTVQSIDAVAAFFVVGSDVYGPMGKELVALADLGAAEEFLKDHRGTGVVRFEAISPDLLRTLD